MKLFDTYSYIIAHWVNGGRFVRKNQMQSTDIVPEYNTIFTKSTATKVFRITGIKPDNLDLCYVDYIRDQMFNLNPDCHVMIQQQVQPIKLSVTGDKFQREMARASNNYENYNGAFNSQSDLAKLTGKTYRLPGGGRLKLSKEKLDELYQVFMSYTYVFNHVGSGGTLSLVELFVELSAPDANILKDASENLQSVLSPFNIGCTEVSGVLKTYLQEMSPAMTMPAKVNKKFMPKLLFTEENLAAFSSYKSHGLVGDSGILMGIDFQSRLPFSVNIYKAPSVQVFLLMGKTGSGKTYAAWQIALSALAGGEYVTAIDIKGREWSKISHLVDTKILTFDEKNPSFVNTLRLDDLVTTRDTAESLYATAVQGTVNLLMLMVNLQPGEGNPNDLELVLREGVAKLYSKNNVSPVNVDSFKNTKSMRYADILPILTTLETTTTYTNDQKRMTTLARARCHAYLGDSGIFAQAFTNEITLSDVLNSRLVIYEFNKNQNAMTDSLDVMRIFMVQYLDSKKKAMLKERGKFLFCFYEELQRCDQFGNLLEYICADVTGARSNNAVVILLLNSLKVLRGERARDIRSNITSFVCGAVESNDIETIANEFNRPWLAGQLALFEEHPSYYRNCFAATVDTGVEVLRATYKVEFPEYLRKQFQTRNTKES